MIQIFRTHFASWLALIMIMLSYTVVPCAKAQILGLGSCPRPKVLNDLDFHRYLGTWYEQRAYPVLFLINARCTFAEYTDNGPGLIGVFNSAINNLNQTRSVKGQAKLADISSREAKLSVSFASPTAYEGALNNVTESTYEVVDTDYEHWSVVWRCQEMFIVNTQFLYILTRQKFPPAATMEAALNVIRNRRLSQLFLKTTRQSNCVNQPQAS